MKDNLNIEELFKEKFNSFEGEVRPDAWTNIQQGINATGPLGATAAKTGLSTLMKTVIITSGIVAATVTGVYLYSNEEENNPEKNQVVAVDDQSNQVDNKDKVVTENPDMIVVTDDNDPIIEERRAEIEHEMQENADRETQTQNNNERSDRENNTNSNNNDGTVQNTNEGVNSEADNESHTNNNGPDQSNGTTETTGRDKDNNEVADSGEEGNDPNQAKVKYPSGKITFEAGDDFAPSTYVFHANPSNYQSVSWEFGDGTIGTGVDVEHTYKKPGKYIVRMTVIGKGEVYEETQTVTIQTKSSIDNIPNVITPNGDRINDFFVINTTEIETLYISIRDDKGNVVFESNEVDFRWYGTDLGGNALDKGRFTYMIFATGYDGSEFKIPGQIYIE